MCHACFDQLSVHRNMHPWPYRGQFSVDTCTISFAQQHHETPLEGGDGTIDDLKQALVENLEHRGVLNKLRAKVVILKFRVRT